MEKDVIKKGNEIKSTCLNFKWVKFKVLESGKRVYLGYGLNEWNKEDDLVELWNKRLKGEKVGGWKWLELWCCEGEEIKVEREFNGDVYEVKEFEIKEVYLKMKFVEGEFSGGKYKGDKCISKVCYKD